MMQPFISKFFFVMQIAYWLHCFPELYFQRVKKEELSARVQYAALYLGRQTNGTVVDRQLMFCRTSVFVFRLVFGFLKI